MPILRFNKFATFFLWMFLFLFKEMSIPGVAEGSYNISWKFFRMSSEDYYRIPQVPRFEQSELSSRIDKKIEKLGSKVPGFHEMVNSVKSDLTVKDLMKSTSLEGLPIFGSPLSAVNEDLKDMMFLILDSLEKKLGGERLFQKLANSFTSCQQVQYRTIREVYEELMDQGSLRTRVAFLSDTLKRKWLMQTIFYMEKSSSYDLDVHLENSYLKAIGRNLGIPHYFQAEIDPKANKKIDQKRAQKVFRSFVNSDEMILTTLDHFRESKDIQLQAEIYKWVTDWDYKTDQVYDDNGLINKRGVENILVDLGVIYPTSTSLPFDIIKRQEMVLDRVLPSIGYSSVEELDRVIEGVKSLSDLKNAFNPERVELSIYAPQIKRKAILSQGLLNQYQTGSSRGFFGIPSRFAVERSHLQMNEAEYERIPLDIRPKYGRLIGKTQLSARLDVSAYGEDVYLLKLNALQDRLTWTPGDSLNRHQEKLLQKQARTKVENNHESYQWDDLFLPWKSLSLLVPFLDKESYYSNGSMIPLEKPVRIPQLKYLGPIAGSGSGIPFVEFQAWGPVTPAEIKSFIFTQVLPDRETLDILAKHQIQTFNGIRKAPTPFQVIFYEKGSQGTCQKKKFQFKKIVLLNEDFDSRYCDLIGKVVYDRKRNRVGTIQSIEGRDGTLGMVKYSNSLGGPHFKRILLDRLSLEVKHLVKATSVGKLEFRVGEQIYSAIRSRSGTITRLFQDGHVQVRYSKADGKGQTFVESIEEIHKKITLEQLTVGGLIFKLNEDVYDEESGEWGRLESFYSNLTARVKVSSSSGLKKDRYFRLERLQPKIDRVSKRTPTGSWDYLEGDQVYHSKKAVLGNIIRIFHKDAILVRYPLKNGKDHYVIENATSLQKKIPLESIDEGGISFAINDLVYVKSAGKQGLIRHFYDQHWAWVQIDLPSKTSTFRCIPVKKLRPIVLESKDKNSDRKGRSVFQRIFSKS
jgi:hypothetical protein